MNALLPDAPLIVTVLHFVVLSALLVHTAVVNVRRRRILRQSRRNAPGSLWSRLLFSLGFLKHP